MIYLFVVFLDKSSQILSCLCDKSVFLVNTPNKKIIAQLEIGFNSWNSPCSFNNFSDDLQKLKPENLINIINKIDFLVILSQIYQQQTTDLTITDSL